MNWRVCCCGPAVGRHPVARLLVPLILVGVTLILAGNVSATDHDDSRIAIDAMDCSIPDATVTSDRSQPMVPGVSNLSGGRIGLWVNLFSGNLHVSGILLHIPASIGTAINWGIFYNSLLDSDPSSMGLGWRHTYAMELVHPGPDEIDVQWADGRTDAFTRSSGHTYVGGAALHGLRIEAPPGQPIQLINTHAETWEFTSDRLSKVIDRNGNAMELGYSGVGLTSVSDAFGRTTQLAYDGLGQLTALTGLDYSNAFAQFDYDGSGRLSMVTDIEGDRCLFGYDAEGRLATINVSGDAIQVSYYGTTGVVSEISTGGGAHRRFRYNAGSLATTVTDEMGSGRESNTVYAFDAYGRCITITDGPLGITQNSWDAANNLIEYTDADAHKWRMQYDPASGDLLSILDPTLSSRHYAYSSDRHLLVSFVDEAGQMWSGQRDATGNLTRWTDPLGHYNGWSYDAAGRILAHRDMRGYTTSFGYNEQGDVTAITDPAGYTTTVEYNQRSSPTRVTDPLGHSTTYTRNECEKIVAMTLPQGQSYQYVWNRSGTLAGWSDPRNAYTSYTYNDRKQVTSCTDPYGNTTTLERSETGWLTRVVNAVGNATEFGRDDAGRVVSIRDADGGLRTFGYGACDLLNESDGFGSLSFGYTSRHELASVSGDDLARSYTYDARGLLTAAGQTAPNPALGYAFIYDAAGRLTSTSESHLGPRTVTYTLDAAGNPTQLSGSFSPTLSYVYDSRGLCTSVVSGTPSLSANLSYTPRREIENVVYSPVNAHASYDYSANGWLLNLVESVAGYPAHYGMQYDVSGNRTDITGSAHTIGIHDAIDYDLRNLPIRLASLVHLPIDLDYDEVGDRSQITMDGVSEIYVHSAAQRLLAGQAEGMTLQWNSAGACTLITQPGPSVRMTYRSDGSTASITANGQTWQVLVGPIGEIARVVLPSGQERWYATDMGQTGLLRRSIYRQPGTSPKDSFVYVPGTEERYSAPEPFAEAATPVMWLADPPSAANNRPTLADPWGSVTLIGTAQGNLYQARAFDPFGKLTGSTGPEYVPIGFLGMDQVEGLEGPSLLGAIQCGSCGSTGASAGYWSALGAGLFDRLVGSNGTFGFGGDVHVDGEGHLGGTAVPIPINTGASGDGGLVISGGGSGGTGKGDTGDAGRVRGPGFPRSQGDEPGTLKSIDRHK